MAGDARYLKLLDEMRELHIKKSAGYAGDNPDAWANFRGSKGFGISALSGCLVRMADKYIRVQNLMKNPDNEKVGENIKDTLLDLASYALIAYCLKEEEEGLPVSSTTFEKVGQRVYKVKVTSRSNYGSWYDTYLGHIFVVRVADGQYFEVIDEPMLSGSYINKAHCEICYD